MLSRPLRLFRLPLLVLFLPVCLVLLGWDGEWGEIMSSVVVVDRNGSATHDTNITYNNNHSSTNIKKPDDADDEFSMLHPQRPGTVFITLSLIVELRGELANHLGVLANARYTQRWLERSLSTENHLIRIKLIGQHQDNTPRWTRARDDLRNCFSTFQKKNNNGVYTFEQQQLLLRDDDYYFDFEGGQWDTNNSNFLERQHEQTAWLGKEQSQLLVDVRSTRQVAFIEQILEQQIQRHHNNSNDGNYPFSHVEPGDILSNEEEDSSNATTIARQRRRSYSLPYLTARSIVTFKVLEDLDFYHDIRSWLALDEGCCRDKPDATETVYHFRNFLTELGEERAWERNFVELSPERTAIHLFGNDPSSSDGSNDQINSRINTTSTHDAKEKGRVAIVSRYPENLDVYREALLKHLPGITVRVQPAQTGVQDFCFLLATQHELVGSTRSTFVRWAAILGNATTNRLFSVVRQSDAKNVTRGAVKRVDSRTFHFDTYAQPERYSLDMEKGRDGKKREAATQSAVDTLNTALPVPNPLVEPAKTNDSSVQTSRKADHASADSSLNQSATTISD